jgi:hypothetical protein
LLLVAMLATFLSPSFGWHMHAEHDEIAGASHGDDDHHGGTDGAIDAHASIGHLLGHLAMQAPQYVNDIPVLRPAAPAALVRLLLITAESAPPYRPPLSFRLA